MLRFLAKIRGKVILSLPLNQNEKEQRIERCRYERVMMKIYRVKLLIGFLKIRKLSSRRELWNNFNDHCANFERAHVLEDI